jgi:hypothetical protein
MPTLLDEPLSTAEALGEATARFVGVAAAGGFPTFTTSVTKVRLACPALPVTSQHPSVGKIMPDGWKPISPY